MERSVVASHEGLVLVGEGAADELAAAVSSISNLWDSLSSDLQLPQQSCVEVAYSDSTHLYTFPLRFLSTRLVLGFEAASPLSEALRQAVVEALAQFDEPQDSDEPPTKDAVSTETGE